MVSIGLHGIKSALPLVKIPNSAHSQSADPLMKNYLLRFCVVAGSSLLTRYPGAPF